jgi:hypothetical protein
MEIYLVLLNYISKYTMTRINKKKIRNKKNILIFKIVIIILNL